MSFLRKIRFKVISSIAIETPLYGYIETLVSVPVRDPITLQHSLFTLAIYTDTGERIDTQGRLAHSYWEETPHTAFIWNDSDFIEAIERMKELR